MIWYFVQVFMDVSYRLWLTVCALYNMAKSLWYIVFGKCKVSVKAYYRILEKNHLKGLQDADKNVLW